MERNIYFFLVVDFYYKVKEVQVWKLVIYVFNFYVKITDVFVRNFQVYGCLDSFIFIYYIIGYNVYKEI